MQIFHPKYYIPIKGEYQAFVKNASIAREMNIPEENIIIADNGEMITFKDGELVPGREKIEVEDVMIDGIGVGDVGAKVIDDRIQLSNDGVVVVGVTIDRKTKKIIAQTDCQTRGFVYLKDAGYVIRQVISICENVVGQLVEHPEMDIQDIRNQMKDQSMKYIVKETGKKPVFISVVIEV
jgi:ribonuclease J